jgi:benzoyl-CoA 2,3-dioxygenase component B
MGNVSFGRIPNNVNLSQNRKLQRALLTWQPNFIDWWMDLGPTDFQKDRIYLRTAIDVGSDGWAHFDYVKMPDYRWGIFLSAPENDRRIPCGDLFGQEVWQDVPGDVRKELRRIIVTQADTEPASVEQQRLLGRTAPSLYDIRNLFQVNVEEGRHLWAMVYLLHSHFGRDGREEAEELLERHSGSADSPRILEAFNKPCRDWLAFFSFAMFMDRDGKYQLASLAESAFDPLSRTTRFMLTEEAHHLFVGETGIGRVVRRTAELMKQDPSGDVMRNGGIPLTIVQKYINEWLTASLDLFGGEDSSNAANYFGMGLKGRYQEARSGRIEDHVALEGTYEYEIPDGQGGLAVRRIPLRRAMNLVLRDSYMEDCQRALARWNKILESEGIEDRLYLPHERFNRNIGVHASHHYDVHGKSISAEEFERRRDDWLPTDQDYAYVAHLMRPVYEPGKFAGWIAPPAKGIDAKPIDFEYVKFHLED